MKNHEIESSLLKAKGIFTMLDLALYDADTIERIVDVSDDIHRFEASHMMWTLREEHGIEMGLAAVEVCNTVIEKLAKEACQVQDACNLSGVVYAFADACRTMKWIQNQRRFGNDWYASHPIVRVWVDKIASLTDLQDLSCRDNASRAHRMCLDLAKM